MFLTINISFYIKNLRKRISSYKSKWLMDIYCLLLINLSRLIKFLKPFFENLIIKFKNKLIIDISSNNSYNIIK